MTQLRKRDKRAEALMEKCYHLSLIDEFIKTKNFNNLEQCTAGHMDGNQCVRCPECKTMISHVAIGIIKELSLFLEEVVYKEVTEKE